MKPAILACLLVAACGSGTQLAPTGAHPPHVQDFVPVDYPPPPAEVEEIPEEQANDACVWVDGHYLWSGGFVWQPGRWVVPAPGCYYAPPVVAWSRAGDRRLYYTPPRWYRDDALALAGPAALCPPPPPCPG